MCGESGGDKTRLEEDFVAGDEDVKGVVGTADDVAGKVGGTGEFGLCAGSALNGTAVDGERMDFFVLCEAAF